MKYIGHIVSESGVEPDPDKISKVVNWPRPSTPEEVRQFLGFVGYYRKFIKDFSKVARPLTDLMPTTLRKTKGKKTKKDQQRPWEWKDEQESAFQQLKNHLSTPPILSFPDLDQPFELHTDASLKGLGAVLYQTQGGKQRVIAYASRGLSRSEKNYPVHKQEFLALKWAVTEKFKDYLMGQKFTVITDNNPLTYALTTAKLDATGHRWISALSQYDFSIKYRPGKNNADADALSRLPGINTQPDDISEELVKVLCKETQLNNNTEPVAYIESIAQQSDVLDEIPDVFEDHRVDIREEQMKDPIIRYWIDKVRMKVKPRKKDIPSSPLDNALFANYDKLKIVKGVLYRTTNDNDEIRRQIVLPASQISTVLKSLHNNMGHQGRDRTTSLVKDRFYWHGMNKDIEQWIQRCPRCIWRKTPTTDRAPMHSIVSTQPMEIICMDFLKLEVSKGGYQYVLVITDHFTRYA